MLALEVLEPRQLLSTINWTNRGLLSDGFNSTFGPNADLARGVDLLVYAEKDSFFWHTLDGAACMRAFLTHFRALPLDGRIAYFKRFDLGPRWVDREAWFHLAFDDERAGDSDYDLAHAEIFGPRSPQRECRGRQRGALGSAHDARERA